MPLKTAARLTPLLTKSSLAKGSKIVSRSSENYLDQERVAFPKLNALELLTKPLSF